MACPIFLSWMYTCSAAWKSDRGGKNICILTADKLALQKLASVTEKKEIDRPYASKITHLGREKQQKYEEQARWKAKMADSAKLPDASS